jgi:hypothetical protein
VWIDRQKVRLEPAKDEILTDIVGYEVPDNGSTVDLGITISCFVTTQFWGDSLKE